MIKTNWIVITGAPSSGKTTIIESLQEKGFRTEPEVARSYLKQLVEAKKYDSMRNGHILDLQKKLFSLKCEREQGLPTNELIFFDRGLPDSLAYFNFYQLKTEFIEDKLDYFHYEKVFYLAGLPVINDEVRRETPEQAKQIGKEIWQAYLSLNYQPILIPAVSIEERLELILQQL